MNDVSSEINDVAAKLLTPSHSTRQEALNKYLTSDASYTTPWSHTASLPAIRRVLELWSLLKIDDDASRIDSTSYDEATGIATVHSTQFYTLPLVHVVATQSTTTTYFHLVKKGDVYLIDAIDDSGAIGEYLSTRLSLVNRVLTPLASLLLPVLGSILLISSNLVTRAQEAAASRPALLRFPLHPVKAATAVASIWLLLTLGFTRWLVTIWQSYSGVRYTISFSPHSSEGQHDSNVTFKRTKRQLSSSSPETKAPKKKRTPEAAKPENLQDNPVPGESYADALKDDHVKHTLKTNIDHSPTASSSDVKDEESEPREFAHSDEKGAFSYAKVVKESDHAHE